MLNDCWVDLGERGEMAPGEELTVRLAPLVPELVVSAVRPGDEFTVKDGPIRVVGRGTILRMIDDPIP
jgi:hypothetical protein